MKPITEQISAAETQSNNCLFKFHIGKVVRVKTYSALLNRSGLWAHVTGFTTNPTGETILTVKSESGESFAIHPLNVEIN